MMTLLVKKNDFDLIKSGAKKEDYREIKQYYITRFLKAMHFPKSYAKDEKSVSWFIAELEKQKPLFSRSILVDFKNGYSERSEKLVCSCRLRIGHAKEEFAAERGKKYFILDIDEIFIPPQAEDLPIL